MGQGFSSGETAVYTHLSQPIYVPGETVHGTVYLQLSQPIDYSNGVFLEVKGREKTHWSRTVTRQHRKPDGSTESRSETIHHHGKADFFRVMVPVWAANGRIEAGQYQFPFSFQLPAGLPGTFCEARSNWSASVLYSVKALVHVKGFLKSNIKYRQELTLHARPMSQIAPVVRESSDSITKFCCINKGTAFMRISFDKNAYFAYGDTAQIICELDASNCKVDMKEIKVSLIRTLDIRDNMGAHHRVKDTICSNEYPGISAGELAMGDSARYVPLPLIADRGHRAIQPETRGHLISNEYIVEVRAKVGLGSGIKIRVPIAICAPMPQQVWNGQAAPPGVNWNATVMNEAVINVPPPPANLLPSAPPMPPSHGEQTHSTYQGVPYQQQAQGGPPPPPYGQATQQSYGTAA